MVRGAFVLSFSWLLGWLALDFAPAFAPAEVAVAPATQLASL